MIMAIVMAFLIHLLHSLLLPSEAEAAENVSMTLTELSVFMKKQELELQLRTEKEKEEGEYLVQLAAQASPDRYFFINYFGWKQQKSHTGDVFVDYIGGSRLCLEQTNWNQSLSSCFVLASAAITEELLKITEDKRELSGLRGFDSPFCRTTETLTGCQAPDKSHTNIQLGGPTRDDRHAVLTPDKSETTANTSSVGSDGGGGPGFGSENRTSAPSLEHSWSFHSGFTPIDHHLHRSPSAPDEDTGKFGMFSPSPCNKTPAPVPYESLFYLALPRAASLFLGQKTSEAVHKAAMERLSQSQEGLEDGEEEGLASASPLEVLDRLVQQGSDAHDKVLKRCVCAQNVTETVACVTLQI